MDPNALQVIDEAIGKQVEADFDPATVDAYDPEKVQEPPEGCGFSAWLWRQENRPDPIGQLARVVKRDPMWRGGDRQETDKYLADLGANDVTRAVLRYAWGVFEKNRQAAKSKRDRAKARKRQRAARKKSRK